VAPPSIPIAIAIIIAAGAAAALLMAAVRRISNGALLANPGRGISVATVSGSALAILLAFVIVDSFNTYSGAKQAAQSEATTSLEMFRTAAYFPPAAGNTLRSDIICYGRAVAYSEWPAMRKAQTSPLVVPWINRWDDELSRLDLSTAREQRAFTQFGTEDDARTDAGVARFRESSASTPETLWLALVIGACLAVGVQLGFSDPSERLRVQGAMVGGLAAILATGLLLVSYLDHPYSGRTGSVKPTAMEFALAAMKEIQPGLKPPCGADGRPIGNGPS
jgi:hypothetical protein